MKSLGNTTELGYRIATRQSTEEPAASFIAQVWTIDDEHRFLLDHLHCHLQLFAMRLTIPVTALPSSSMRNSHVQPSISPSGR